ncbi:MAG: ABC transporter permease [Ruminococcus sp.]|nr:ABC transporter permease [Ruminococcus sp.]
METDRKVTKFFSRPLMHQNIKSNWVLILAITLVMVLMGNVMNYAISMMETEKSNVDVTEYQQDFYGYLGSFATYNSMTGLELSYEDFISGDNTETYETAFEMLNSQSDMDFSVEDFQKVIDGLTQSNISLDTYVTQFEYSYALAQQKGAFSGEDLSIQEMLNVTFEIMGVDSELINRMSEMDTSAMMNQMYYTLAGLLPIFILIVILANGLIAEQVDRGSMAYVLSTPTKRSAVSITQMIFMIVVPLIVLVIVGATRIFTTYLFFDTVNAKSIVALFIGMYILIEAVCGICYLASCWFSQSKKAMGVGGGLTVWFFLASMIGMFGSENMVDTGMGVEELSIFNKLTLVGLYDVEALSTVGTDSVDTAFVWKLLVLVAVAVCSYVIGAVKFSKKDLPL